MVARQLKLVNILIELGADLHHVTTLKYGPPVVIAAAWHRHQALTLLMAGGADIRYRDADGRSVLHFFCTETAHRWVRVHELFL